MTPSFRVGPRPVGAGHPCLIVGEIAQAHDGSLGFAHAFIDSFAGAGADAVKFQTHIAAAESTPAEPWRVKFSPQDVTRYDYWRRMEFAEEHWDGLKRHAEERGLVLLSSPFSGEAVDLLERLGMVAWRVASGEVPNAPLLDRLLATKGPLLLPSGMSSLTELDGQGRRGRRPGGDATSLHQERRGADGPAGGHRAPPRPPVVQEAGDRDPVRARRQRAGPSAAARRRARSTAHLGGSGWRGVE